MRFFIITVILIVAFFAKDIAQQTNTNSAHDITWAWVIAPVNGIAEDSTANAIWGGDSPRYLAWDEKHKRQYRDRGTMYFEKHPGDNHFKEWLLKTTGPNQPEYYKNPEKYASDYTRYKAKGTPLIVEFEDQSETEWSPHYLKFRNLYLSSPDLTAEQMADFQVQELQNNINRLYEEIYLSAGNLNEKMRTADPLITRYCIDAINLTYGASPNYYPLTTVLSEFGEHNPNVRSAILSVLKTSKDTNIIAGAIDQEALIKRLSDRPVRLKLNGLGEEPPIDLKKLHGKVIMLDFWNVHCGSCIAHMPKFERLYKQYHHAGFELVSVCVIGYDGKGNEMKERSKAIQIERKFGITYPTVELDPGRNIDGGLNFNEKDWKYFDCPAGGAIFFFDKQGQLTTMDQTGQWMEFEIRKLLGQPLGKTGLTTK